MFQPTWNLVTQGTFVTQVSAPPGLTTVWALNAELPGDNAYFYSGPSNGWVLAPGAHLTSIAAAVDGSAWGVDATNTGPSNIFFYSDGRWIQPLDGYLTTIALGLDGEIWGVNASQPGTDPSNIYRYVGGTPEWMGIAGYLTDIAVGSGGVAWGVNSNLQPPDDVFRYTGGLGDPWEAVTDGGVTFLDQVALGADNSIWGVDGGNQLWVYVHDSGFEQVSTDTETVWVSASDANSVWRVDNNGAVYVASFPALDLSLSVDGVVVYEASYRTAVGGVAHRSTTPPGVRSTLERVDERWHNPQAQRGQQRARDARPARRSANPGGDVTTAEALEVTKFAWQILKDGRPTWSGARYTQSSVLNPAESSWTLYTHATPGASSSVTAEWRNPFNMRVGSVRTRLAGTSHAAPAGFGITPGYYIPDMHFLFEEVKAVWGFSLDGEARISNISNTGGTTLDDPINPLVTLSASIRISSWVATASETYYFTATGTTGFATATT